MKKVLCLVVALVCALSAVADEYGYFIRDIVDPWEDSPVSLHTGDRMVILASDGSGSSWGVELTFPNGMVKQLSGETHLGISHGSQYNESGLAESRTIVGPCDVIPIRATATYISYKIIRASDNSIKPTNVISLPADVDGDMQLVFESSDDLLEWTQVYSFTHNSTNQASRFFRTRLIQGSGE
jgi:hypothetical protein